MDKVVIVTGATSRIGQETARYFAEKGLVFLGLDAQKNAVKG